MPLAKRWEDFIQFVKLETSSNDLEPWALIINEIARRAALEDEERLWVIKLYNSYDSMDSTWQVFRRWNSVYDWERAHDKAEAAKYQCTQERRNLRGGRVLQRFASYHSTLGGLSQREWIDSAPQRDFLGLMAWTRQVWGVGRQSAFEWVEFLAKSAGVQVVAPHACLWESEGPRRSLQSMFGVEKPTPEQLDELADKARRLLVRYEGIELSWEDFETVICDFHVMRHGRYYPGKHLAALREEIEGVPDPGDRALLLSAFKAIVPSPWNQIAPGISKPLLSVYRDTGQMVTPERAIAGK